MKLEHSLFALVVGMCLVMTMLFVIKPAANAKGTAHPKISSMSQGGDGQARHGGWALVAGWILGVMQISFFVGTALFAIQRQGRGQGLVLLAGAAHLLIFAMLIASYVGYLRVPEAPLVWSFPRPTTWMLFGLWTIPVVFTVLYVVNFSSWVFSADDEIRFQKILVDRDKVAQAVAGKAPTDSAR